MAHSLKLLHFRMAAGKGAKNVHIQLTEKIMTRIMHQIQTLIPQCVDLSHFRQFVCLLGV